MRFDPLRHVPGWCSHAMCDKKAAGESDRCYKHRRPVNQPTSPQQKEEEAEEDQDESYRAELPRDGFDTNFPPPPIGSTDPRKAVAPRRGSIEAQAEAFLGLAPGPKFYRVDGIAGGGRLALSAQLQKGDLEVVRAVAIHPNPTRPACLPEETPLH